MTGSTGSPNPKNDLVPLLNIEAPRKLLNFFSWFFTVAGGILTGASGNCLNFNVKASMETLLASGDPWFIAGSFSLLFGGLLSLRKSELLEEQQDYQKEISTKDEEIAKNKKEIEALKNELEQANRDYIDICEGWLEQMLRGTLQLEGVNERATVYKYSSDAFFRLGRWSDNPQYKKPGKKSYLPTVGVIGKAWNEGEVFANGFPDPTENIEAYVDHHNQTWSVPKLHARTFTMKSRCYAAYAVREDGKKNAVLVLESTDPNGLDQAKLNQVMPQELERLSNNLKRMKGREMDPTYAAQKGF